MPRDLRLRPLTYSISIKYARVVIINESYVRSVYISSTDEEVRRSSFDQLEMMLISQVQKR
jgi:hypothetical protein